MVEVQIFSVAHSGGGVQSGSPGFLGSLFGVSPVIGGSEQGNNAWQMPSIPSNSNAASAAATLSSVSRGPGGHFSFAFESADDIRYLMGRVVEHVGNGGLRVSTPEEGEPRAVLCIVVSELGIDQSDFNALVYSEKELVARATIDAFVVGPDPEDGNGKNITATSLGRGSASWRFREDFFLGMGPLSGGKPEEMQQ